jgi:hypothetical protein
VAAALNDGGFAGVLYLIPEVGQVVAGVAIAHLDGHGGLRSNLYRKSVQVRADCQG